MRRFRQHRELLEDSLETTFTFESIAGLEAHIRAVCAANGEPVGVVTAELYARPGESGDDARIGWKSVHLVIRNGVPFGWMEGPLADEWELPRDEQQVPPEQVPADESVTSDELVSRMQAAISGLPVDKVASFHARFLAYLEAGLADELLAAGDVEFGHCDAQALGAAWKARRP